jgi:hypothetical protein
MGASVHGARMRVGSAMLRFAAVAVLVAMSVEMAPPTPAAAAVLPVKTEVTQAPSAKLTPNSAPARKTKTRQEPTEVPSLRSAYSNTYDCETAPTLLAA